MLIAYLFLSVTIICTAIFMVFRLIRQEQKLELKLKLGENNDPIITKSPSPITAREVLKRLNIDEKETAAESNSQSQIAQKPVTETPAVNQKESELLIKYEETAAEYQDLQLKYEKLSSLLNEKIGLADKHEKSLNHELKNRKEFNKVKDILEKELKDHRDKAKDLQASLTTAQTEVQSHLKRITQLEENINKLEKNIMAKDEEIITAQGEIQSERARAAELITQLQKNEEILREKDKKIENLVERLRTHPLPAEQVAPPSPSSVTDTNPEKTDNNSPSTEDGTPSIPDNPVEGTNGMDVNNIFPCHTSSTFGANELNSVLLTTHNGKSPTQN